MLGRTLIFELKRLLVAYMRSCVAFDTESPALVGTATKVQSIITALNAEVVIERGCELPALFQFKKGENIRFRTSISISAQIDNALNALDHHQDDDILGVYLAINTALERFNDSCQEMLNSQKKSAVVFRLGDEILTVGYDALLSSHQDTPTAQAV